MCAQHVTLGGEFRLAVNSTHCRLSLQVKAESHYLQRLLPVGPAHTLPGQGSLPGRLRQRRGGGR